MAEPKIKVAVIDDHNVVRLGIKAVLKLSPQIEFAGESDNAANVVPFLKNAAADVVLIDIRMPGKNGIEALSDIRAADLPVKVIMLTTSDVEDDVAMAVKNGADGYALKDLEPEILINAIKTVHSGGKFFPPEISRLYEQYKNSPEISQREKDILSYLAKGFSNIDIAKSLNVSPETVKMHLKRIYPKLNAEDRAEAVAIAISRGIIKV